MLWKVVLISVALELFVFTRTVDRFVSVQSGPPLSSETSVAMLWEAKALLSAWRKKSFLSSLALSNKCLASTVLPIGLQPCSQTLRRRQFSVFPPTRVEFRQQSCSVWRAFSDFSPATANCAQKPFSFLHYRALFCFILKYCGDDKICMQPH